MKSNSLVPELSVSNFRKSVEFYTKILGFEVEYMRNEEGFAMLRFGQAQIMIDQIGKGRTWKTGTFEQPLGRGVNFQIEVKNIRHLLERLKENKVKLFVELEEKWYRKNNVLLGNKQFLVQDPDGYLLRFFENLGTKRVQ